MNLKHRWLDFSGRVVVAGVGFLGRACNIVGAIENEDGWKWVWVSHHGQLHMWGPFKPNWDKF
jgi:hypothetical protein